MKIAQKILSLAVAAMMVWNAGFANAENTITVKGSDTLLVLGQLWAEEYMKKHPEVTIQVTGGGSGVGLAALVNGTTDIANASRQIKQKEVDKARQAGYYPVEFKVGIDSLAVVVNKDNPIKELTLKQLMGIYLGKINNWADLGGANQTIIRYSRESSSGTYQFFKEFILKNGDFAADAQTLPGTAAVANAVTKDPGGIGYGGAAYFIHEHGVKILSIKKDDKSEAVSPVVSGERVDFEAAWSGRYPIWRHLYMYPSNRPKGAIKEYMNWILSEEGQKLVEEVGYVPMPKK